MEMGWEERPSEFFVRRSVQCRVLFPVNIFSHAAVTNKNRWNRPISIVVIRSGDP
jgi:hypothetical protein